MDTVVVLGASGDLAGRLLFPALARMHAAGTLGPGFRLLGAGTEDWTAEQFAGHVTARLRAHDAALTQAEGAAFVGTLGYHRADVGNPTELAAVLRPVQDAGRPVVVYLALPTQLMAAAARALRTCGLPPGSRLAVEKPFGQDARSAAELEAAVSAVAGPAAVYRVDHALALTTVQQVRAARRLTSGLPVGWSAAHLAQVDLLWEETLALEGRASFYDRAGALRDIVQNHLLQLLCTVARGDGADTARCRADVLRAVRPLDPDEVRTRTRRARYTAGRLARTGGADGRTVPDYVDEPGVDASHGTETFAELVLRLDTPRWTGTRFVLRAGKALSARRRGVLLHFRPSACTGPEAPLWLDIDASEAAAGGARAEAAEPAAYRRIVADLLAGGTTYAVSAAEVELAWQVVMPVLAGWAAGAVPLTTYPAGSDGPASGQPASGEW